MRIGFGYDAHKLVKGRKLILEIPNDKGLLGHSDADVLIHAIIDALIGAIGAGSIGDFFPDTDPKYKDVFSLELLSQIVKEIDKKGFAVNNVDTTVVCQSPKLKDHISSMREILAGVLGIDISHINIKGKTEEGMGFTGRGEGISAYAVVLIHKKV